MLWNRLPSIGNLENARKRILEMKEGKMMGIIQIDVERCKSCGLCIKTCPLQLLQFSSSRNSKGYHPAEQKNSESCTGCALCALMCPDSAIQVYREERN